MWGIIPAAGAGSRIQPLAFSKELLPVGSRQDGGFERPRAVSEYLVERMLLAGATKICFVISSGKSDIMEYFGASISSAHVCYTVQQNPRGLCDAIFRPLPMIHPDEPVLVGLPDTIWFPEDGFRTLNNDNLSFLLFPVTQPQFFDAVVTDTDGCVLEIQVKKDDPSTTWVWGAFKLPGSVLHSLFELWCRRGKRDEYIGTLVNAYLSEGNKAKGVRAGHSYVDVGTIHGYREAIKLLSNRQSMMPTGSAWRVPEINHIPPLAGKSEPQRVAVSAGITLSPDEINRQVNRLGKWFHNINLKGVQTAPDHFLGDYPAVKWRRFAHAIPPDLKGKSVLDLGCNAGFYSIEMKRRGASRVVGVDIDGDYLAQARFAAEVSGVDIELYQMSVYEVEKLKKQFDIVLFMGVLYHLRYPLLALDLVRKHVVKDLFVVQTMLRGNDEVEDLDEDYSFWDESIFARSGFPRMFFIEKQYSSDPTNWWIPNRACAEAMLRTSGFHIVERPEREVFICRAY